MDFVKTVKNEDEDTKSVTLLGCSRYERWLSLMEHGLYSDLTLEVTDYPTNVVTTYKVHKAVFAVMSPVWESSIRWTEDNILRISGFPNDLIKSFIHYAYTNTMSIGSIKFCLEVIIAADFYNVTSLENHCVAYIKETISSSKIDLEDFISIFNTASLLDIVDLIEICIAYIQDIPCTVFCSEEFLNLSLKSITYILRIDHYLLPEFYLFSHILRWSKSQRPSDLRKFLIDKQILSLVRLRLIHPSDFQDLFSSSVLTDDEKFNIHACLVKNEPFPYDYLNSDCSLRGGMNKLSPSEVVVLSPPIVIFEEFIYQGEDLSLTIDSIALEPRLNLLFRSFTGQYENSVSVKLPNGSQVEIFEITEHSKEVHLNTECVIDVRSKRFKFEITLKAPGIYPLNANFSSRSKNLIRLSKGIIRGINLIDTVLCM